MCQARGSTDDLPTWVAMREPSIVSGDGDSDADEVDQIRATPAPSQSDPRSDRPVYKRKETDWKIESAPKRAKHDQIHNIWDNSRQENQSTGDSGSDGAHHKPPRKSTGASSSMLAPPLPSRSRQIAARKSITPRRPLSKNQTILSSRPGPPADTPALKSKLRRVPSKGKNIPSSLDSTLFSNVSSKVVGHSGWSHRTVPDPNDVIEISSGSSDTPPPSLKAKNNIRPPNRRQENGTGNNSRPKKTLHEVIEVLDSDEEIEMQRSSHPTPDLSSRGLPSPKRTPSTFRMTTKGKSVVTTPPSVKSPVQDRGNTSRAANLSPSPVKRVPDRSSLSISPILSRFSQTEINPTSSPPSLLTERALGRLSAGHPPKMSGISNASEEGSIAASVSDDEGVNMIDLHAALGIPLPPTKDARRDGVQSTLSSPKMKRRLVKTARKSMGWRNSIRMPGTEAITRSAGTSSAIVIDLTGDASDDNGEQGVSESASSKNGNLSAPPTTASDTVRVVVKPLPLLSPSPSKAAPLETAVPTESNKLLLTNATSPLESVPVKAFETSSPSDPDVPSSGSVSSPEPVGIRIQDQSPLSPNAGISTNFSLSAGLPHENSSSSPPLHTDSQQQTTSPLLSEPAPSTSESCSSSSPSPSLPKQPLLTDAETQVTSGSESHPEPYSQILSLLTGSSTPIAMCLSSEANGETYPQTPSQMVLPQTGSATPSVLCQSNEANDETHPQTPSQMILPQTGSVTPSAMCLSSEADIAEKLLADDESDDAMQEADEFDNVVGEGASSMDEEQSVSGIGMRIDDEVDLSESLPHSQSTITAIRLPLMTASSDSGLDTSSEPGLGINSPISVPSTRRSSFISNTSEEAEVQHISSSRSTSPEDIGAFKIRCSTLGGFPAYRFESYRKDPKNFPKVNYASDLPSSIQDHINNQPEEVKMLSEIRGVFEAMILENTADDERDAPPIVIQNSVDDEPTPPWEFWYSNKMWHGEGVPDPDVKNLKGCDCRGACNPRNKDCTCAQRQCQAMGDDKLTEFAYDKNGKLKFPGFPIFECNNTCWCGPECTNRVVQLGRKVQVVIRKTENKGWGVFNGAKKIPQGTFIGIYAGELLTDEDAHMRGLKYNKAGTTYLFDLDFHHLKGDDEEWTNIYTVDAYHTGNFTRFLNHSCNPNCRLYPCYINEGDIQKPLLVVFSIRDIEPDTEICFNYQGTYPGEDDDEGDESPPEEDSDEPKDKIYTKCLCGATNCRGIMFA